MPHRNWFDNFSDSVFLTFVRLNPRQVMGGFGGTWSRMCHSVSAWKMFSLFLQTHNAVFFFPDTSKKVFFPLNISPSDAVVYSKCDHVRHKLSDGDCPDKNPSQRLVPPSLFLFIPVSCITLNMLYFDNCWGNWRARPDPWEESVQTRFPRWKLTVASICVPPRCCDVADQSVNINVNKTKILNGSWVDFLDWFMSFRFRLFKN